MRECFLGVQRRHLYVLTFSVPALLAAFLASAVLTAVAGGFLWIFVFGDNTWPDYSTWILGGVFVLILLREDPVDAPFGDALAPALDAHLVGPDQARGERRFGRCRDDGQLQRRPGPEAIMRPRREQARPA